jgi:pSer/pThr/pTyr-binding forkhead associated (FHA) protein
VADCPPITLAPGQSKRLGRGAQADVVLNHPTVSRIHARIVMDSTGQLAVDDLRSTNGVFVNGTEQRSAYLMVGDVVRFGEIEYVVAEAN